VFLLTAGSLADRFGRRRLFLIGLVAFCVTSVLCALAPSPLALILARVAQGVAAAIVFPSSLAILAEEFQGPERRQAIGVWGAVIGLSFAAGPLLGGVLVDTLGWRSVFAANLALGLPAIALAVRHVGESRDPDPGPVDWAGVGMLCLALFLIVLAVLRGNALGWTSGPVLALLAGGVVALVAFVAVEGRQRAPMIDLALFRNPTFAGASLVISVLAAATFGSLVYLTLFLLNVQGRGPIEAGLVLAPLAVVSFAVSALAGRASERLPLRAAIVGGLLVTAVGLALLLDLGADAPWGRIAGGLAVAGAGVGLVNPLVTFAHLGVLPPAHGGLASALNNTARQVGLAIGIAVLGALLQAGVRADLGDAAGRLGEARGPVLDRLGDGDLPGALQAAPPAARGGLADAYGAAFSSALDELFLLALVVNLLAAIAAALLIRPADLWGPAPERPVAGSPQPAGGVLRPEAGPGVRDPPSVSV
jgi:EmrB/QacA subfamily drug resistance transporter